MTKFRNISFGFVLLLGLSAGTFAQRNDEQKKPPPKDPAPKVEPKEKPPRGDNRPKDDRPKKPDNGFSIAWRNENGTAA